jgi:hypothetical protein
MTFGLINGSLFKCEMLSVRPGTDAMIFKKNSQKNLAKKLTSLTQTKDNFAEKVIVTLVIEKNANFSAENW